MPKTKFVLLSIFLFQASSSFAQANFPAMSLESALDASTSGMIAQKIRLATIAENVANNSTARVEETGLPYQKKYTVMEPYKGGVRVKSIEKSREPFYTYPDGTGPDTMQDGNRWWPNVNLTEEMINLSYTEVMYEANATCLKTTKAIYQAVIDTLK